MESITRNQATMAQIRRLEDASLNPLTGNAWPKGHDDILQGRRKLPVYERFEEILDVYHQNQVFILASETGSGKSTQVPQLFVYDEYASGLRIACTQPRRLATTALARRVSSEMGVVLGEEVGYQIGGNRTLDKNNKKTRLAYLTEGVLLGKQAADPDLSEFACIIIDEAHERTVETDLLMAMLKKAMRRRKDLKVIIMSATMDATLFQGYFNNCPLVHMTGRSFQVDVRYVKPGQTYSNFNVAAANTVVHIHEKLEPGHILVFLPGQGEIRQVCELLRKATKGLDIFPLYSTLAADGQSLALDSSGPNRKCIVSTNIAETSLTIDGVVYVVDTGLSRQMKYNPRLAMDMLQLRPISQASAKQRTGRAGRTRDGVCFRLYSKQDFDRMAPSTQPAIRSTSIHNAALKLISIGRKSIIDFDWIAAPHPEVISRAVQDFQDWGYMQEDGESTRSGDLAAECPLDPIWYRAIEEGAKLDCAMSIFDIAILCSAQKSIFARPPGYEQVADQARRAFATQPSDHLALANAFNFYMRAREKHQASDPPTFNLGAWCKAHFLDIGALEEARKTRQRIGPFMKLSAKISPGCASATDQTSIRKALAIGLFTQTAIFQAKSDTYRTVHENVFSRLAPLSSLISGNHEWIVYTSLNKSGRKIYLQTATAIDPEWLVDLPYFQAERLPLKGNGLLRQENVKKSLDAAKARREAMEAN